MTSFERPEFSWSPPEFPFAEIPNDESLPTDSLLTSLTIQRNGNYVMLLRDFVKGRSSI